ncbi:MAG: phenylalanine--tRNA ligase subunit beta [Paludibacteraceae bacterium]|nr:phenylalanine--tRNA ligase subunit beta [Paludibacteraceae bacterium]
MNISYKWLKRYLDLQESAEEVAKHLTSIGLEVGTVEEVQTIKGGLQGLVTGEVLTCVEHPDSDHLHITTVAVRPSDGSNEPGTPENPLQIVCGAPNCRQGLHVIVATLGTVLYSGDESFTIKKSKIRGVESFGMLCAEDEIGIGASHDGIIELPADTPVGIPAAEYYHVESDYVIEVDITPNRSDGASHYGVARDLYAYYKAHGVDVKLTKPQAELAEKKANLPIEVEVVNREGAPRYSGICIAGVTIKESPEWLQNALRTIGLRPINNVVDVTNFVLHEMGQALHAFDYDKIRGHKVVVKNALQGQHFTTLDGIEREMSDKDLMIWNAEEPMCIAGVFGGQDSGVSESTKNVFLESAYFEPVTIRKTARRHGLSTDASFRYERGCDPNNTLAVLKRCAELIQETAGGEIASEIIDIQSDNFEPWKVTLTQKECNNLIGKAIPEETIKTILKALEINIAKESICESCGLKVWELEVPRYRVDVQRPCDVIEDILRIYGYNNVELSDNLRSNLSYSVKPDSTVLQRKISEQLTAQGFNEILNNSLTKMSYYEGNQVLPIDGCVRIMNPLSQDLGVLRQTLLYGGLESISRNVNSKNPDLKFYEFGNCYHFDGQRSKVEGQKAAEGQEVNPLKAYSEETHLGLWLTGNKTAQTWTGAPEKVSFYTLRGHVETVLRRMGVNVERCSIEPFSNELFSDGLIIRSVNKQTLGFIAIVDRKLRKQFDIENDVYYADLQWAELLRQNKMYKPVIKDLPKFPEVKRDLALLVDKTLCFSDLLAAAKQTEKKLLKDVYLFDVYEGKNLEPGKKSYALSFILQDEENTLKDNQIEAIMAKLQKTFEEKFNAKLR